MKNTGACAVCDKYGKLVKPIEFKFIAWRKMNGWWFVAMFITALHAFLLCWDIEGRSWQSHIWFIRLWGFLHRQIVAVELIDWLPETHPNCRALFIDVGRRKI